MADVDESFEDDGSDDLITVDDSTDSKTQPPAAKPAPAPKPPAPAAPVDDKTREPGPDGKVTLSAEEYALLSGSTRKANREAAERRAELKRLQAELDEMKTANASEQEKALIAARKDAETAAEARWRPQIVQLRADAALAAAGCKDAADRELLLGRVKAADVELDDNGSVVGGLEDQIASLKERYPRMFAEPRRVPGPRDVDAGNRTPPPAKKRTTAELLAEKLGMRPD
jgi:hypothetical protein